MASGQFRELSAARGRQLRPRSSRDIASAAEPYASSGASRTMSHFEQLELRGLEH